MSYAFPDAAEWYVCVCVKLGGGDCRARPVSVVLDLKAVTVNEEMVLSKPGHWFVLYLAAVCLPYVIL